ncbi:FtsX-like permease family protein [Micromonospora sp. WMMD1082]|uniref:FtsX-like permease family protein n=1 Tax=Micromonospora sp. WMMD1082 TaxID=3016104 RepID=UPI0024170343|nr:FtsX-like permease family protein [Micromonospora sp. WMMD1082]MDG4797702.1 hypothetical protein [Micromonospora sp. WMMD1082]
MLALIAGALAARRMQAIAVLLLATLAGAAAAAAPIFATAAGQALADHELATAAPDEHRLRLTSIVESEGLPTDADRDFLAGQLAPLTPAGFDTVLGAQRTGRATGPDADVPSMLVFRQGTCERVAVTGTCPAPTPAGQHPQAMISTNTAAHLGITVGDPVTFDRLTLTVVGVYRPLDPRDAYWAGNEYLRPPPPGRTDTPRVGSASDAIFIAGTSPLADDKELLFRTTADLFVTAHTLRTRPTEEIKSEITAAQQDATRAGYGAGSRLPALLDRVADNRHHLNLGVTLGGCLLVLLCWLVLFMVVASAADERRPDQGLLMLRGVRRTRLWALAIGEHAVPALAAIPLACLAGLATADLLATHTLPGTADITLDATALGYATAAAAGALAAVLAAQLRTISAPVTDLLRRVPARGNRWRAGIADIVAISVAAAAVVQLRTGGPATGLALLAPIAAALAVGLLAARVAMGVGATAGGALLRHGRTATGLALVQLARQPRIRPLVALLTVVIGLLAFTAGIRDVATTAYTNRAIVEVGAPRVVGVDAMSRKHLLDATRAIDPPGHFAMAVVVATQAEPGGGTLLAVDSARLATVAEQHPSYGTSLADMHTHLHPAPPAPPLLLRGRTLTLTATATYDTTAYGPLQPGLYVTIANDTGSRQVKADTPITPGTDDYLVRVPECETGCRLANITVNSPRAPTPLHLRITELRHGDGDTMLTTGAELARPGSWRYTGLEEHPTPPEQGSAGLNLTLPEGGGSASAVVADTPHPLPAWPTRSAGIPFGHNHSHQGFDGTQVATRVVGLAERLPRTGPHGTLVDLEYADRLATGGHAGTEEVWLATTAPPDVLDQLRAHGLVITYDRTITATSQTFDRQGPALALDFNLFAAAAGALIGAAGIIAAAAVGHRDRVTTLVALRRQGLPARAIRGGYGWIVAAATAAGSLAAGLIWILTRDGQRLFRDGHPVVPLPTRPDIGWLASITLPAVAAFTVTATVAGLVLVTAVNRRSSR